MKRILFLIIIINFFQISYGDDINSEKQQLAWDFIQDNMLSRGSLPIIFRENITINLKGKVIREDSLAVKDIIQNIQKAIPNLKISISSDPGNLIVWLNDGITNYVAGKSGNFNSITKAQAHIQIPVNCSFEQRKQFIYFKLMQGGLIFYRKPTKVKTGMSGCVFAENDYLSINYSPLDLFILENLYSPDFQTLRIQNLNPSLKQTAMNSIRAKFMGNTQNLIIYRNDIAIQLNGKISAADSICMNELIQSLRVIIPNRKIYLAKENANLIFNIDEIYKGRSISTKVIRYNIISTEIDLSIPQNTQIESRKAILMYNLYRSLVHFSPSNSESTGIQGSVFDIEKPEFLEQYGSPLDLYILKTLYANDFKNQFKTNYIEHISYRKYLIHMYHKELDMAFLLLGLLVSTILLTVLIIKGSFKPHRWIWSSYIKQGLLLIAIGVMYAICLSLNDLELNINDLTSILNLFLSAFVGANLIYLGEKSFLMNNDQISSKVIIIFFTTFITLLIVAFPFNLTGSVQDMIFDIPSRYNTLLPYILAASLARSLYIFLNDRYRSIIRQKDVELAQLSVLHKQAELHSLRAKINPHFLYNALNSIASLASTDAIKTEHMALSLSDYFKYSVNREEKQFSLVSEELDSIRTYLEIEKIRFGDRMSFVIECAPDVINLHIPQLLIQPLVENAIKHGLSKITENGLIKVSIAKEAQQLIIKVCDNGTAFPDGPLSGFGLRNIQDRIALIYGTDAVITWKNMPEKYIGIILPIRKLTIPEE